MEGAHGGDEADRPARRPRGAAVRLHLGDGPDRPHAAAGVGTEPTPGSGDERVEGLEQVGRALLDRRPLARDRRLVAARDGPREGLLGARGRPVLQRRAGERDEQLARDAGGGGEPLGGALERDEEVRGDRGGGVVGGAVGVGDLDGAHPEGGGQGLGHAERGGRAAGDRAAGARERGRCRPSGTVIRGWRLNAVVAGQRRERGGAGAVADEARTARGQGGGRRRDLLRRGRTAARPRPSGSAPRPSGPSTSSPAAASAARQGVAQAAGADDGAAQGWGDGGVPVQFSHEIPAGRGRCCGLRGPSRGGDGLALHDTPQRAVSSRPARRGRSYPPGHAPQRGTAPRGAQGRLPAGVGLHALPAARRDPPDRRVRLGPRGRRPDVRRRGAGRQRGQAGRAVRRPGGQAAGPAARRDRRWRGRTSSWSTS